METTREIASRTFNEFIKGKFDSEGGNDVMYWSLWKKAFDMAEIEFKEREKSKNT